jgi:hypothetical protein
MRIAGDSSQTTAAQSHTILHDSVQIVPAADELILREADVRLGTSHRLRRSQVLGVQRTTCNMHTCASEERFA